METMVQRNVLALKGLDAQLAGDVQHLRDADCMLMLARLGHMHLELAYVCTIFLYSPTDCCCLVTCCCLSRPAH
jgi:hypothetical protein